MTLPRFEYLAARTVAEACAALEQGGPGARVLAGGTDLLAKMRAGVLRPSLVIGLRGVGGLDAITIDRDGGLHLGAGARIAAVAAHAAVRARYPAVIEAALETATVQIRNMATLLGNLCNASPCADNVPTLIALGAEIELARATGTRRVPLEAFFVGPGATVLAAGEIATWVHVPAPPAAMGAAYAALSGRSRVDISAAAVASAVTLEGDCCVKARIVLGGVGPTPLRAPAAEGALAGHAPTEERIEQAAAAAASAARPISDVRASAWYRRRAVAALTRRTLRQAIARARTGARP